MLIFENMIDSFSKEYILMEMLTLTNVKRSIP